MKILIADHEASHVKEFEKLLQETGFSLILVNTGQEALSLSQKEQPDLILLGEMLPGMTGNDVLRQLKANLQTQKIPVAILSHFKDDALIAEAIDLGAVEYILKDTMSSQDLVNRVQTILQQQKKGGTGWSEGDAQNL